MSYDKHRIAEDVFVLLAQDPGLSLTRIAGRIHVDRHTVTRALSTTWGMTFREVRQKILAKKAAELFRTEPSLSIKEIAFQVGFSSSGSLSHFVKRAAGVSATEYRSACNGRNAKLGLLLTPGIGKRNRNKDRE